MGKQRRFCAVCSSTHELTPSSWLRLYSSLEGDDAQPAGQGGLFWRIGARSVLPAVALYEPDGARPGREAHEGRVEVPDGPNWLERGWVCSAQYQKREVTALHADRPAARPRGAAGAAAGGAPETRGATAAVRAERDVAAAAAAAAEAEAAAQRDQVAALTADVSSLRTELASSNEALKAVEKRVRKHLGQRGPPPSRRRKTPTALRARARAPLAADPPPRRTWPPPRPSWPRPRTAWRRHEAAGRGA